MAQKLLAAALAGVLCCSLNAEETTTTTTTTTEVEAFKAFTGKVNSSRVRLRLAPTLDSTIVRELDSDDMLVVIGEQEDFYVVAAPTDTPAYVYRTLVLDGQIEGTHVNVRLAPNLEAPILTQLNTGDTVKGTVDPDNNKWLKIDVPATAQMFVAREYLTNVGSPTLMQEMAAARKVAQEDLLGAYTTTVTELRKPFEEITLDTVTNAFQKIIETHATQERIIADAAQAMALAEDLYLQKKIAFLESKTRLSSGEDWKTHSVNLEREVAQFEESLRTLTAHLPTQLTTDFMALLNTQLQESTERLASTAETATPAITITEEMRSFNAATTESTTTTSTIAAEWEPSEWLMYEDWTARNPEQTLEEFYAMEMLTAQALTGLIQPYTGPVKNKPGDYVLVDAKTRLPIAYLYSTQIDLADTVGEVVTVKGAQRPNNNFAFPAYHVMSVE